MVDDVHMVEDWQPLSHRQRRYLLTKHQLSTAVKCGVWAASWWVVTWLYQEALLPEMLAAGLRYWIGFFVCLNVAELPFFWWFESRRMGWQLSTTQLSVRSGWRGHIEQIMPLCRVQTYQSVQGWLARLYGLTEVTVAASGNNQLTISYLTQTQAVALTDALQQAAQRDVAPSYPTATDKIIEEL